MPSLLFFFLTWHISKAGLGCILLYFNFSLQNHSLNIRKLDIIECTFLTVYNWNNVFLNLKKVDNNRGIKSFIQFWYSIQGEICTVSGDGKGLISVINSPCFKYKNSTFLYPVTLIKGTQIRKQNESLQIAAFLPCSGFRVRLSWHREPAGMWFLQSSTASPSLSNSRLSACRHMSHSLCLLSSLSRLPSKRGVLHGDYWHSYSLRC